MQQKRHNECGNWTGSEVIPTKHKDKKKGKERNIKNISIKKSVKYPSTCQPGVLRGQKEKTGTEIICNDKLIKSMENISPQK